MLTISAIGRLMHLLMKLINSFSANVSLVKTRLRDSRRGEIPSTVGVRQPNPYENVRIFLECAIYQTHVKTKLWHWHRHQQEGMHL